MSAPRKRGVFVALAMGVAVAVVIAIVLIDSDDESQPPTPTPRAQTSVTTDADRERRTARPARPAGPGAPVDPSNFEGPEERAGAKAVHGAYQGLANALKENVVPVQVDTRTALEDAEGVAGLTRLCDAMSSEARDETVEYARVTARLGDVEWTCEKAMALLVRRTRVNRGVRRALAARVVTVSIRGDQASATLSFGKGQPLSSIPLVKEDGQWKIGSPPGGSADGGG